jgi:heme exporter protein A
VSAPPAAQLAGVALRFGRSWVLRGIDLELRVGESVALFGPNGSGKSTLLRVLAGGLAPAKGEGRVFGFDLRDKLSVRQHVHLLGHDAGLYPDLTAAENLRFSLALHGQQGEAAQAALLSELGLEAHLGKRVRQLSAGLRKRVLLARLALVNSPLLLIDEPFANLDADSRELSLEVLSRLQRSGKTLLISSHEPELAEAVTGRSLRMEGGRLVAA